MKSKYAVWTVATAAARTVLMYGQAVRYFRSFGRPVDVCVCVGVGRAYAMIRFCIDVISNM